MIQAVANVFGGYEINLSSESVFDHATLFINDIEIAIFEKINTTLWIVQYLLTDLGVFNFEIKLFDENDIELSIALTDSITVSDYGDTGLTLDQDVQIEFSTRLTPFYSNPEEIIDIYPDVSELEAAEQIQKYSLYVKDLLKLGSSDPPLVAVEFVTVSALCYMAKKYGDLTGLQSEADMITLGDFTVQKRISSGKSGRTTRDNSTNWCELALAIKRELTRSRMLPKQYIKASVYKNPIPKRYFKDINDFHVMKNVTDSGRIDEFK